MHVLNCRCQGVANEFLLRIPERDHAAVIVGNSFIEVKNMSKEKTKKEPKKSLKDKRRDKREKKSTGSILG